MLGTGDVDFMDPNISYYTAGYLNLRMWDRQLLSYPAVPGQTTDAGAGPGHPASRPPPTAGSPTTGPPTS